MFQDYYKALEDADEKVQLANQIYDLVSCVSTSHNTQSTLITRFATLWWYFQYLTLS